MHASTAARKFRCRRMCRVTRFSLIASSTTGQKPSLLSIILHSQIQCRAVNPSTRQISGESGITSSLSSACLRSILKGAQNGFPWSSRSMFVPARRRLIVDTAFESVKALQAASVPRDARPAMTATMCSGWDGLGPRRIKPKSRKYRSPYLSKSHPGGPTSLLSQKIETTTFCRLGLFSSARNSIRGAQCCWYFIRISRVQRLALGFARQ